MNGPKRTIPPLIATICAFTPGRVIRERKRGSLNTAVINFGSGAVDALLRLNEPLVFLLYPLEENKYIIVLMIYSDVPLEIWVLNRFQIDSDSK